MKKILYIWKDPFPFEIRIQKICESLVKFGYDVTVLSRWKDENTEEEVINGVRIIRAGFKKNSKYYLPIPCNPIWKSVIKNAISNIRPDLIINREFYLLTETVDIAQKFNIPVIVDMAENYPAALREFQKNQTPINQFFYKTLKLPDIYEKFIIPKANGVIVVCDEQIPRLATLGVNENDICVVHNTPNLSQTNIHNPSSIRTDKKISIVHHGYLSGDKSIKTFIEGFLLLCNHRNDIEFVIAGTGECYNIYKQLIQSSAKFANRIKMVGKYNIADLSGIISQSSFGVLPFKSSDFNNYTIHNKIFDYFSNSKPVLASLCKPLIRIIEETNAGIAADCSTPSRCADAIELMINAEIDVMEKNAENAYLLKYNWQVDEITLKSFIGKFI